MYAEMKQQETGPRWEYYSNEQGYKIRKNVLEMIPGRILEVLKSSFLKFFIKCEKSRSTKYFGVKTHLEDFHINATNFLIHRFRYALNSKELRINDRCKIIRY